MKQANYAAMSTDLYIVCYFLYLAIMQLLLIITDLNLHTDSSHKLGKNHYHTHIKYRVYSEFCAH